MTDLRSRLAFTLLLTGMLLGLSPYLSNLTKARVALATGDWHEVTAFLYSAPVESLRWSLHLQLRGPHYQWSTLYRWTARAQYVFYFLRH